MAKKDIDISEIIDTINNLNVEDLAKIGTAPTSVKVLVLMLAFITVLFAGSWFFTLPLYEKIQKAELEESDLKQKYVIYQTKAANLSAYKKQLADMKKSFAVMLRQLPNSVNIENLLVDLTQTSIAAGLQIEKFEPLPEVAKEFYAITPIDLQVKGTFHQFGNFVSGLAALPRIVTLDEIEIKHESEANHGKLIMTLKAKTYRYLDKDKK